MNHTLAAMLLSSISIFGWCQGEALKIETVYSPIPFMYEQKNEMKTVPLTAYLKYDRLLINQTLSEYRSNPLNDADMLLFTLVDAIDTADIDTLLAIGQFEKNQSREDLIQQMRYASEPYHAIGGAWQMRLLSIIYKGSRVVYVLGVPEAKGSDEIADLRIFRIQKQNDGHLWESKGSSTHIGGLLSGLLYLQYVPHLYGGVESAEAYAERTEVSAQYEIKITPEDEHGVCFAFDGTFYRPETQKTLGNVSDAASIMPQLWWSVIWSGHWDRLAEFMGSTGDKTRYLDWLKNTESSKIIQYYNQLNFQGRTPNTYFVMNSDPIYVVFVENAENSIINNPLFVRYSEKDKALRFINMTHFGHFYRSINSQGFRNQLKLLEDTRKKEN